MCIRDSIYTLREKMESEEAQTRLALRQAENERDRLRQRIDEIEVERQRILAETCLLYTSRCV